jgi:hypothetical protein
MSRRRPFDNLCKGKKSYKNVRVAHMALTRLAGSSRQVVPVRTYYCDLCDMWHLTSQGRGR